MEEPPERNSPALRTIGGRGRVRPGEPAYSKTICLSLVDGVDAALRSATDIDRGPRGGWRWPRHRAADGIGRKIVIHRRGRSACRNFVLPEGR
ncbi:MULTISPECIES: DUF1403 family protein [unclassified Sinorhizobium]|uniref:DUF1403 family protein n=1 Tax=unclassified Sinorhizobium TaxID=2613772 RepID=UPI003525507D